MLNHERACAPAPGSPLTPPSRSRSAGWAPVLARSPWHRERRLQVVLVLDIAEGAGREPGESRRNHYRIAAGSASEVAAVLDLIALPGGVEHGNGNGAATSARVSARTGALPAGHGLEPPKSTLAPR